MAVANALLPQTTIGAAGTFTSQTFDMGGKMPKLLSMYTKFLYGAGGTSVNVYLQTSFDGGVTWMDVVSTTQITTAAASFFWSLGPTTGGNTASITDGALAANSARNGVMGRWWRVKYVVVGTYTGATSLEVDLFGSY